MAPQVLNLLGPLGLAAALLLAGCASRAPSLEASVPETPAKASPFLLEIGRLSFEELLSGRSQDWRVAQLKANPAILVIEFPNLKEQGAAMNRIAALVEKADGPRERLLEDEELQRLIEKSGDNAQTFYLGHDYSDVDLARFFSLAQRQGVKLRPQEARLRQLLVRSGMLLQSERGLKPQEGSRALVSFTATQVDDPSTSLDEAVDARRRSAVLRHELSHGEFYTNESYRRHCMAVWRERFTPDERQVLRRYLLSLGYDGTNEDLLVNEAQALLLHTRDERDFSAADLGIKRSQLESMRRKFQTTD